MKKRYEFTVIRKLPSLNEIIAFAKMQGRGSAYARIKRETEKVVVSSIGNHGTPNINNADITMTWHEQHKRRDPDNVAASCKYLLDGMVASGLIENDTYKYIKSIKHNFKYGSEDYRVDVLVEGD